MSKLINWLSAIVAESTHSTNASSADLARTNHVIDQVRGIDRVVDRHLSRIAQREQNLSEFAGHIAKSSSLNDE
jgi:hypothetical protein